MRRALRLLDRLPRLGQGLRRNKMTLSPQLKEYVQRLATHYEEAITRLATKSDHSVSPADYKVLSRTVSELGPTVEMYCQLEKKQNELHELETMVIDDSSIRSLVKEDKQRLLAEVGQIEERVCQAIIPKDLADANSAVLEVRAGTGGIEAALFTREMLTAYEKLAAQHNWMFEELHRSESEKGGIKEASVSVFGDGVFGMLKYECGVHRVQRVPQTDAFGRVHTSTMTVAVLPLPHEVELQLNPADVKVETFRSGGAGGQHVNKTDSAVRLTHLPTGIVISMQEERSQLQNRSKAMKLLHARLYELQRQEAQDERSQIRRQQIGTAMRSEKIRTYNFPQDRVTDHRIGKTIHGVQSVLEGGYGLVDLVEALQIHYETKALLALTQTLAAQKT